MNIPRDPPPMTSHAALISAPFLKQQFLSTSRIRLSHSLSALSRVPVSISLRNNASEAELFLKGLRSKRAAVKSNRCPTFADLSTSVWLRAADDLSKSRVGVVPVEGGDKFAVHATLPCFKCKHSDRTLEPNNEIQNGKIEH
ncbi:hypothetical protein F2P81_013267 [Scophthalmus maximus]|uniref:Uncharacterized protein n=1 Tax=Scophthalmus maximus TaxID=52904 RepID=A0A6A4SS54_SCOMX|nr:hypothetical protein F2P81_013267 [Scophthalmus maximus]